MSAIADDSVLVGIDLGTTNSLIAVFEDDGPRLIENAGGSALTPSVVSLSDDGDMLVGEAARHRLITHPGRTAARFKRHMGTRKTVELGSKTFRAEELSALVLRSLVEDAERDLGRPVTRAVISVPAYFNDVQRKATIAAGRMAGLKVERLVNEPTAAALAYGLLNPEEETTVLVVDLGGGTFDVSILEVFDGVMEVRASSGDAFLGGEDFTTELAKHFRSQLGAAFALKPEDEERLRRLTDDAKRRLSENATVSFDFALGDTTTTLSVNREQFETLCAPLLSRMRLPLQRAVSDAGLRSSDIDKVVLVGGATRMPVVRQLVTRLLKCFPEHGIDPDEVVARGTAVQAGLVSRHKALDDIVMTDVAPFTMGTNVSVEVAPGQFAGGHYQPVIERNTVIPVSRSVINSTVRPNQDAIELHIYQGESPMVRENVEIGQLNVPLPPSKELQDIDIRFTYDVSGALEVLVTVLSDNSVARTVIEGNPGSLTKTEIDARFDALSELKIHPRDAVENTAVMERLKAGYEMSLGPQRDRVRDAIVAFEGALQTQNEKTIALARQEISAFLDRLDADRLL